MTLYSRPGCHLCDEARDGLLALGREGLDMQLHEVDIETDDRLHAMYLERIPVIALGGEIVSELEPDLAVLRARLDTLRA